jgi:iron-sulfur cluster assembly protein
MNAARKLQVMTLTDRAAERVKAILATRPGAVALRIGVKKGGCAGMEYTVECVDKIAPFEDVVEHNGAKVVVDPKAVMYLLGTEMDYRVDKLAAQFVFTNPNQRSSCGCGESVDLVPASEEKFARA